jgi:alpha/beta superfamily hydrolase
LRFNFRGVGGSEGEPTTGIEEVADAHGAVDLVRERFPEVPVAIAGWSFGGAVAIKTAAERDDLSACVAIAPAVKEKPGVTAGLPPPEDLELEIPLLVVVGANDDLTLPTDCKAWAERAGTSYVEIPAANHFFWAKYEQLTAAVAEFLEEVV